MTHEVFIDGKLYVQADEPIVHVGGKIYVPSKTLSEGPVESKPNPAPSGRWHMALHDLEPDYPTGAWGMSDATAHSQVNMSGGRDASKRIVEINLTRAVPDGYWQRIRQVAAEFDIPAEGLCAIFCRESHHGYHLDAKGEGDRGYAFGVGQVDRRYHDQRGRPDPYSIEHMRQCAEILIDYLDQVERKHRTWKDKYIWKGGIVAYNGGVGNVATIQNMDRGTTGNDYGADTCARAQFYSDLMPE